MSIKHGPHRSTSCAAYTLLFVAVVILASSTILADERPLALRNPRVTVEAAYDELEVMSADQTRSGYSKLAVDLRADLWIVHLQRFLDAHPAIDQAERDVVLQAIGLIATGLIDRGSDPATTQQARTIVDAFSERALRVMTRADFMDAFVNLGEQPGRRTAGVDQKGLRHHPPIIPLCAPGQCSPECTCAGGSDWCDEITNPDQYCNTAILCTPTWGCGTLLLYDCNGICWTRR